LVADSVALARALRGEGVDVIDCTSGGIGAPALLKVAAHAKNLGLTQRRLFMSVILPGSMPFIMVGIKTTVALSWAVVVAAELIAAQQGLGHLIMDAATFSISHWSTSGLVSSGSLG
jgi:NitT/TauT family transport system permease protein